MLDNAGQCPQAPPPTSPHMHTWHKQYIMLACTEAHLRYRPMASMRLARHAWKASAHVNSCASVAAAAAAPVPVPAPLTLGGVALGLVVGVTLFEGMRWKAGGWACGLGLVEPWRVGDCDLGCATGFVKMRLTGNKKTLAAGGRLELEKWGMLGMGPTGGGVAPGDVQVGPWGWA